LGVIDSKDFNDEFFFEKITEYEGKSEDEGKTEDGPQETILNLENEMEELKDYGLDLIIEEEAPM
jgi:hypothetical protein